MYTMEKLQEEISNLMDSFSGEAGVSARLLPDDETLQFNGDRVFPMASVFKIPILVEFLCQCAEGELDLTGRLDLEASSFTPGSGVLRFMDPGLQPTWKDLAMLMIIISDNTATDLILDRVGAPQVQRRLEALGLTKTRLNANCATVIGVSAGLDREEIERIGPEGLLRWLKEEQPSMHPDRLIDNEIDVSTPADMTLLLSALEEGRALSGEMRDQALQILKSQRLNARMPARLPMGTEVAHKTGTIGSVVNDAGIVYIPGSERKAVLTVFTAGAEDNKEAEDFIASVTAEIFQHLHSAEAAG